MGRINKQQLRRMAEAHLSVAEIARIFDVHTNTVYSALEKMGLPLPTDPAGPPEDGQIWPADGSSLVALGDYPRIDAEIAVSGGHYAALAEIAGRHGLSQTLVTQKWHQIRLNHDLMAAAAAETERRDQTENEADTSRRTS